VQLPGFGFSAACKSIACGYKAGKLPDFPDIIGKVSEQEAPAPRKQEDEPMLWCPVCSTRLSQRKCKLFCETCGYYMSCADYY
jgi:hypothetical protein